MRAEENLHINPSGEEKSVVRNASRRRWSEADRRQIVEETLAPGASVARVSRAHGVNANLVFTWRKQYRQRVASSAVLLPVKITQPARAVEIPAAVERRSESGAIQITVGKSQIRIEGDVNRETLRLVLKSVLR